MAKTPIPTQAMWAESRVGPLVFIMPRLWVKHCQNMMKFCIRAEKTGATHGKKSGGKKVPFLAIFFEVSVFILPTVDQNPVLGFLNKQVFSKR